MVEFVMQPVPVNPDGWGPPETDLGDMQLSVCDFVDHLDKFPAGKVGRICDFTISGLRFQAERSIKGKGKFAGKGKAAAMQALDPNRDEENFTLVDRPIAGKAGGKGRGGGGGFSRNKGRGKGMVVNYQEGILGQRQRVVPNARDAQKGKGKGKNKGGNLRRGLPSFRDWSVQTRTEWEMKEDITLTSLAKLQLNAKSVEFEDLLWCGTLHNYNRGYDRLTVKTEKPLRRFEDSLFFNISASDDPHLQQYLQEDASVSVIATDKVLACLVAAARSVYSWDIVVSKIQGKLMFDKREGSQIDLVSVNETAMEPPSNDDPESIDSPGKLSYEAGCINQNFSQMCLDMDSNSFEMDAPNPFQDEDDEQEAASGAYRYRKITLPGDPKEEEGFASQPCVMVVRTEVNAKMPESGGEKGYVTCKALNEFDSKSRSCWRKNLETQRGACLATELKNNSFKLGRWTAEAILGGCDTMKIGYVSRIKQDDPHQHSILGVQTHLTDNFAEQIGLTRNNVFGILRCIVDMVMTWEDGKYLLLKDPMKSVMRIYELPWEAFQSDDEEGDGEEEEEEQELDEDGNVAPQQPEGPRMGARA